MRGDSLKQVKAIIDSILNNENSQMVENGKIILSEQIPGTKPVGYCYELFQALPEDDIQKLMHGYRKPFPKPLAAFYKITNGMFMFGRFVSIFGVPEWGAEYKQPVPLAFADGHRTKGCPPNRLFFASYATNPQMQIFFNTDESGDDMKVYAAKYGNNKVIAEWDSFGDWFVSEHVRYSTMYQENQFQMIDVVEGVLRNIVFES